MRHFVYLRHFSFPIVWLQVKEILSHRTSFVPTDMTNLLLLCLLNCSIHLLNDTKQAEDHLVVVRGGKRRGQTASRTECGLVPYRVILAVIVIVPREVDVGILKAPEITPPSFSVHIFLISFPLSRGDNFLEKYRSRS